MPRFGPGDSALARYATRFDAVEVDSSFHRPHRRATWERWAATVPAGFRFSVKLPRTISLDELRGHAARLGDFPLLARGNRLSVLPVTAQQWNAILALL